MNIFEVAAFEKPVVATIEIPGSKSYTNRALVMAALTKGPVTLDNPLYSEDTEAMIACFEDIGTSNRNIPRSGSLSMMIFRSSKIDLTNCLSKIPERRSVFC